MNRLTKAFIFLSDLDGILEDIISINPVLILILFLGIMLKGMTTLWPITLHV